MSSIKIISINDENIFELVKTNIYSCRTISRPVCDTKFHHQTKIENIPRVLRTGLLSKGKKLELEGRKLTEQEKYFFSDDCHVNGIDYISLSSNEVDFSQRCKDEFYFDPDTFEEADIVISKDVKAHRNSTNYFNEFLVRDIIPQELFNSIDIGILRAFNQKDYVKNHIAKIQDLVKHYNNLRKIALALKESNLDIPFREVSYEIITLDPDKVIELPQLVLK